MLNIILDLDTGLAKLAAATTIAAGSQVPVTIHTVRGATDSSPGASPYFELGLGTDATPPVIKAYLDSFTAENDHTFTGVLNANDSRLVSFMAGQGTVNMKCEVAWTVAGQLDVAPSFALPVQSRVIPADPTSEGGPSYYTETETDTLLATKLGTTAQAADVDPAGTSIAAALAATLALSSLGTNVQVALGHDTNSALGFPQLDGFGNLSVLATSASAINGIGTAGATGIYGTSDSGYALSAISDTGLAIYGHSTSGNPLELMAAANGVRVDTNGNLFFDRNDQTPMEISAGYDDSGWNAVPITFNSGVHVIPASSFDSGAITTNGYGELTAGILRASTLTASDLTLTNLYGTSGGTIGIPNGIYVAATTHLDNGLISTDGSGNLEAFSLDVSNALKILSTTVADGTFLYGRAYFDGGAFTTDGLGGLTADGGNIVLQSGGSVIAINFYGNGGYLTGIRSDDAYTDGVIVPTGYITLYDSAGVKYKIPALAA